MKKTDNPPKTSKAKNLLFGLIISFFSFVFCLGTLEIVLRAGLLDGLYAKGFTWIPPRYKAFNRLTDARNAAIAVRHSMKFTDRERSVEKPAGVNYRIAVLGDSFIQGDGVSYDGIWSHILEKKMVALDRSTEVLSWGFGGWSTAKQFGFFQQMGIKFKPDLLIIGFVLNDLEDLLPQVDPNAGVVKRQPKIPVWKTSISSFLTSFKPLFPFSSDFLSAYFEQYYSNIAQKQTYTDALQETNFGDKNLQRYDALLAQFKAFCDSQGVEMLFVLTPNNYDPSFEKMLGSIKPLLEKNKIAYVDTYPAIKAQLSKYTPFELRSNPSNGHPGELVTQVYAQEAFDYLVKNGKYGKAKGNLPK